MGEALLQVVGPVSTIGLEVSIGVTGGLLLSAGVPSSLTYSGIKYQRFLQKSCVYM